MNASLGDEKINGEAKHFAACVFCIVNAYFVPIDDVAHANINHNY